MKSDALIHFYEKNERYISPAVLLAGFIWDNLTLRRIDLWVDNLVIIAYLSITGLTIIFLNAYYAGRLRGRFFEKIAGLAPFFMQFSLGGLFSAFLIFYSRSGSLAASWPFILVLVFFFIGNEVFRQRYQKLVFQVGIFFIAVYSYAIFAIPLLLNDLGSGMFLLSGLASVAAISLFILILFLVMPKFIKQSWRWLAVGLGGILMIFNLLYFANFIPPVPLSLNQGGISHSVVKNNNRYIAQVEAAPWYLFYKEYNPVFHWQPGQRVYCYASVFAPAKIKTDVFHRWSFYDIKTGLWDEKDKIKYPIAGGRDGGYRGYTYKTSLTPGRWRVDVINEQGQVLGRLPFEVVQADIAPELTTINY